MLIFLDIKNNIKKLVGGKNIFEIKIVEKYYCLNKNFNNFKDVD